MCDKIKEDDERMQSEIVLKNDCIQNENKTLNNCLVKNNHDWRQCKNEIEMLKKCVDKSKINVKYSDGKEEQLK